MLACGADLAACDEQSQTEAVTGWMEWKTGTRKAAEIWRKGEKEGKQNEQSEASGKTSQSNLEKYGQISPNFSKFSKFLQFAYLLHLLKFGRSSLKFPQI
jgi:hypothetical protein